MRLRIVWVGTPLVQINENSLTIWTRFNNCKQSTNSEDTLLDVDCTSMNGDPSSVQLTAGWLRSPQMRIPSKFELATYLIEFKIAKLLAAGLYPGGRYMAPHNTLSTPHIITHQTCSNSPTQKYRFQAYMIYDNFRLQGIVHLNLCLVTV
jgi:hypothetical protein